MVPKGSRLAGLILRAMRARQTEAGPSAISARFPRTELCLDPSFRPMFLEDTPLCNCLTGKPRGKQPVLGSPQNATHTLLSTRTISGTKTNKSIGDQGECRFFRVPQSFQPKNVLGSKASRDRISLKRALPEKTRNMLCSSFLEA